MMHQLQSPVGLFLAIKISHNKAWENVTTVSNKDVKCVHTEEIWNLKTDALLTAFFLWS